MIIICIDQIYSENEKPLIIKKIEIINNLICEGKLTFNQARILLDLPEIKRGE